MFEINKAHELFLCVLEGMKMRGMKNETNGTAKPNKVVSDDQMLS